MHISNVGSETSLVFEKQEKKENENGNFNVKTSIVISEIRHLKRIASDWLTLSQISSASRKFATTSQ